MRNTHPPVNGASSCTRQRSFHGQAGAGKGGETPRLAAHLSPRELILSVVSSMVGVGAFSFLAAPKMRRIAAGTVQRLGSEVPCGLCPTQELTTQQRKLHS